MRVIIFSGNHPRHLYVNEEVVNFASECAAVVMEREQLVPNSPLDISEVD